MKKVLLVITIIVIAAVGFIVYKKTLYETKFEIISHDQDYEIGLITTSSYSRSNAYPKNVYRIIYEDEVYVREENGNESTPSSYNLELFEDQIIYDNFGILVTFENGVISDNDGVVSNNTFGNYLQTIVSKEDRKIIFDANTKFRIYDIDSGSIEEWEKYDGDGFEAYYDYQNQKIYATSNYGTYVNFITTTADDSTVMSLENFVGTEAHESSASLDIKLDGTKLVIPQDNDLYEGMTVYPIRIVDIKTGEVEKEIYPEFNEGDTGFVDMPAWIRAGNERMITMTKNGYVQDINLVTEEVITYDITDLEIYNEVYRELIYAEEDDSIYIAYSHLNDDNYITIYDITEGKEVLKCEINKNEQIFSGFVVNNKSK